MSTYQEEMSEELAQAEVLPQHGCVALALAMVADSIGDLSRAVERLGTNNAATNMGALELVAKEISGIRDAIERTG